MRLTFHELRSNEHVPLSSAHAPSLHAPGPPHDRPSHGAQLPHGEPLPRARDVPCPLVRVICRSSPCLKRPFYYSREPTFAPIACIYIALRSRAKFRDYHPINTTILIRTGFVLAIFATLLLNLPIYGVSPALSTTGGVVTVDSAPNRSYS